MKSLMRNLVLIAAFLTALPAWSQLARHPRAIELEKMLSAEGLEMLKGRFPGYPFILTVSVDPLLRRERGAGEREKLPSYDMVDEEIVDEWDDPALSLTALMGRVRKISATVSVPAQLSEDEISELRSALTATLGLIEARDQVTVQKRTWSLLNDNANKDRDFWTNVLFGVLALSVLLAGLYGLAWYSTDRLGRSYREAASQQKGASSAPLAPTAESDSRKSSSATQAPAGDLRFDDPIRTRESVTAAIRLLEEHRSFPSLEDMIILDKAAQENPAQFGALFGEFPTVLRDKIFSFSSHRAWMDACIEPGEISIKCVEVLNRCLRLVRAESDSRWQELMILVWRLDTRLLKFLAGLPQNEAFAILSHLPKAIAIPAAREAYPGAWASLLNSPKHAFAQPSATRIDELKKMAVALMPLRDRETLEAYRNERELVRFLRIADPSTEKEVYTTAGPESHLWEMRPPFFRVFEADEAVLESLSRSVRIDDWALAMFNVQRTDRRRIENKFGDKHRARYFEILKSLDMENPDRLRVGEAREMIGRQLKAMAATTAIMENDEADARSAA